MPPDTHHSSEVPFTELEKLDCFHFPLPKKSEILSELVIEFTPILRTRVYTDIKDPHEAVVNIAWVELHRKDLLFWSSCLFPISHGTFQSQGHHNSFIRVHHAKIPVRMPSIENHTRISLFVTEPYLMNRFSLCSCV